MRIERVPIGKALPPEDEYGNKYLSRDYGLKCNQDYIEELAASFKDGEPNEPPVLVPDGDVFRIKCGNTRIMAMRKLGTEVFTAIIDEDSTPQSLVEAAIRTNTKKKYEDVEQSRFTQQLAMFGDDQYVSEVTGIERERVGRIRKGAKAAGSAAREMSLFRCEAIASFEDMPDAVRELTECAEEEWTEVRDQWCRVRRNNQRIEGVLEAFADVGIPEVDDLGEVMMYVRNVYSPHDVPESVEPGTVALRTGSSWILYGPKPDADPEEERRKAEWGAVMAKNAACQKMRLEWLATQIGINPLLAMRKEADKRIAKGYPVTRFIEEAGDSLTAELEGGTCAIVEVYKRLENGKNGIWTAYEKPEASRCSMFVALLDAMIEDGYQARDHERETYEAAKTFLDEQ